VGRSYANAPGNVYAKRCVQSCTHRQNCGTLALAAPACVCASMLPERDAARHARMPARARCEAGGPAQGTILPGVTRRSIIELARARGYDVEEVAIPVADAMEADEVFTTGTAVVVSAVGSMTYQARGARSRLGLGLRQGGGAALVRWRGTVHLLHDRCAVRLHPERAARVHNKLCASCPALPLLQPRHAQP
jgi:hypothetical protein